MRFAGELNPGERSICVGAGILNGEVQKIVAKAGFFWAPDPTSAPYSTVGGNIATNAGGPRTVKYGATRDNVLALTAITGDGSIIHTGFRVRKVSTGYDLTRLLIGSEGTLAIVTEALLKLLPLPQNHQGIVAIYASVQSAAEAIISVMRSQALPASLEFMDNKCLALLKTHHPGLVPENAAALLLLEVDDANAVDSIAGALAHDACIAVEQTHDTEVLWQARKALSPLLRNLAPKKINEDIVIPVVFLPAFLEKLDQLEHQYRIPILAFGHAGDGNLHVNMLVDPSQHLETTIHHCLHDLFQTVLAFSGALSGEHGIGLAKRPFMQQAFDASTLEIMIRIKKAFDPKGILNPGKLLPFSAK
jgi:D-lactate dehydrogenase